MPLYIAEFSFTSVSPDTQGKPGVAPAPPAVEQTVAIGGGSTSSFPTHSGCYLVRLHSDAICSVAMAVPPAPGAAAPVPVATTGNMRMIAGQTEYFSLPGGSRIAVIGNT